MGRRRGPSTPRRARRAPPAHARPPARAEAESGFSSGRPAAPRPQQSPRGRPGRTARARAPRAASSPRAAAAREPAAADAQARRPPPGCGPGRRESAGGRGGGAAQPRDPAGLRAGLRASRAALAPRCGPSAARRPEPGAAAVSGSSEPPRPPRVSNSAPGPLAPAAKPSSSREARSGRCE